MLTFFIFWKTKKNQKRNDRFYKARRFINDPLTAINDR